MLADVLVAFSAWCRASCGCSAEDVELEVAARVVHRALSSTHGLYLITRHFVWLVPLINLVLFLGLGVLLGLAILLWPRQAGWLSPRLIIALAIFPVLMVARPDGHLPLETRVVVG